MRVTLAYPHDGHQPDETVDLPEGAQLVADGLARPFTGPDPTRAPTTPPSGDTTKESAE